MGKPRGRSELAARAALGFGCVIDARFSHPHRPPSVASQLAAEAEAAAVVEEEAAAAVEAAVAVAEVAAESPLRPVPRCHLGRRRRRRRATA